jgi:hypothetical protein
MRTAVAVLALLLAPLPAHAAPQVTQPACSFVSTAEPTDPGTQAGEISGGPVTAYDLDVPLGNPVWVALICSLHTGWNVTHDTPAVASATGVGPGVAVLPPTPVTYPAGPLDNVTLCGEVAVTGAGGATTRLYWDDQAGAWTTDPTSSCGQDFCETTDCGPMPDLVGQVIDAVNDLTIAVVDPVVCPVLAQAAPPEGDLEYVWDCPPYDG